MSKTIFVISCFYDGTNEAIFNCIESIHKNYKKPKIVVIDSNSPDKSYFNKISSKFVKVINAKNKNYDTGAYWIAFKMYKKVNFFYFLQDSVIFKKNLKKYEKNDLTTFRYFLSIDKIGGYKASKTKKNLSNKVTDIFKKDAKIHDFYGFDYIDQATWSKKQLLKTSYFFPKIWASVFGPMFLCKRSVMEKLYKKNFNKILPSNKTQQMCMERLFGIAFQQEGYDCCNSIQGENFTSSFSTKEFEKVFYKRK